MTRRTPSLAVRVTLTAAVLAMGLSACSGGSQESTGGKESATSSSASAGGQKVAATELAQRMASAVEDKRTAKVTVRQSGGSGAGTGFIRQDGDRSAIALTLTQAGGTVQMRLLPGALYLDTGQPVNGRRWLKVSATGKDPVSLAFGPLFETIRQSADLRSQVAVFGKAGEFTVVGQEDVGGVPATHYRGVLPKEAIIAQLPAVQRESLAPRVTADAPVDLWLDASGLPLRLRQSSSVAGTVSESTVEYSAWGQPVTIEAPPAADTSSPSDLPSLPPTPSPSASR